MDESLGPELGRKRRGRPRQYATPQDKTNANVKQRRAKRQKATSDKRSEQHAHFYNAGTLSLPPISLQVDGGASVQRSDHRLESAAMLPCSTHPPYVPTTRTPKRNLPHTKCPISLNRCLSQTGVTSVRNGRLV
jgi:hypothetical protein